VHGLGVALGSEIFKFNEAERAQITAATVKAVNRRVPVIINSGAAGTDLAVFYSRAAEAAGADALMVIPPSFMPVSSEEIFDYYRAIDAAVGIPIILQDVPQGPISPGLALRIADACKNVRYIKVETQPVTGKVQAMADAVGERLTIFGGAGGSYFIEELRRGAHGTMPFCSQPADFVAVWDAFQRGDEAAARQRFDATIMAVNRLGNQGGDIFYAIHKQLLVRRGIIRNAFVRSPTTAVDPITQREIDELLATIVPTPVAFGA
jgi:4-hydroxy-tetrahydrodipicolinate synthase